jgi:hypothetical protein
MYLRPFLNTRENLKVSATHCELWNLAAGVGTLLSQRLS